MTIEELDSYPQENSLVNFKSDGSCCWTVCQDYFISSCRKFYPGSSGPMDLKNLNFFVGHECDFMFIGEK